MAAPDAQEADTAPQKADSGILQEDAGETISCVGYIGKEGMKQTDKEIIKIMLQ